VLLSAASADHSRSGGVGFVSTVRTGHLVVRQSAGRTGRSRRAPVRLRIQSAARLSRLARRAAGALSHLPLVRGCQTAPPRCVVKLSVVARASRPCVGCTILTARRPCHYRLKTRLPESNAKHTLPSDERGNRSPSLADSKAAGYTDQRRRILLLPKPKLLLTSPNGNSRVFSASYVGGYFSDGLPARLKAVDWHSTID